MVRRYVEEGGVQDGCMTAGGGDDEDGDEMDGGD